VLDSTEGQGQRPTTEDASASRFATESSPAGELPAIPGIEFGETVLRVRDEPLPRHRWEAALRRLGSQERGSRWWLGDLLVFGGKRYGETYDAAADQTGLTVGTLMNLASVARKVPPENRDPNLPWRAHRVVAPLPHDEQRRWLSAARAEDWTADDLEQRLRANTADRLPTGQNGDLDHDEHWAAAGMPGYDPPEEPWRVVVSFETEAERDEFLARIGSPTIHNRTGRTSSIWWPDRPMDDVKSVEFK